MSIIIGICGNIGSGKTISAEYLKKNHKFLEYAFADPLKKIASVLGFEEKQLYGTQEDKLQKNKHWGISAREFMQQFGTDICRDTIPKIIPNMDMGDSGSIWVKLFEIYMENLKKTNKLTCIVVSDVRFHNESESIKRHGGIIIKINRPNKKNGYEFKHTSEMSIDKIEYDVCITNDGSIDELHKKLFSVIYNHNLYK